MDDKEAFLKRWSRLKQDAAKQQIAKTEAKPDTKAQNLPKPELPPIEKLNLNSDFSGYMHSKVEESLRRTALKKLFNDPHFHFENMDKLDVYLDDYSIADPIPPDMLARLIESSPQLFPPKENAPRPAEEGQKDPKILSMTEGEQNLEQKLDNATEASALEQQDGTRKAATRGKNIAEKK